MYIAKYLNTLFSITGTEVKMDTHCRLMNMAEQTCAECGHHLGGMMNVLRKSWSSIYNKVPVNQVSIEQGHGHLYKISLTTMF